MRRRHMTTQTRKLVLLGAALAFITTTAKAANNAEQVVFSTPGFVMNLSGNSSGLSTTPFGFWVWCAAEPAPTGQGGYQNDNACQGSMYFYALDTHATGVVGFSTDGSGGEGTYIANVFQGTAAQFFKGTLHPDYACTLENTAPDTKGVGQTVVVHCSFGPSLGGGTGTATVTNAVVNVTGP